MFVEMPILNLNFVKKKKDISTVASQIIFNSLQSFPFVDTAPQKYQYVNLKRHPKRSAAESSVYVLISVVLVKSDSSNEVFNGC